MRKIFFLRNGHPHHSLLITSFLITYYYPYIIFLDMIPFILYIKLVLGSNSYQEMHYRQNGGLCLPVVHARRAFARPSRRVLVFFD